jgi:DsbC/DsbD-like thiol-disulfide interchange protein
MKLNFKKRVAKNSLKLGFAFAILGSACAAQDVAEQIGVKNIELLQGWRTATGTHMAAIHITLKDGWKTYWRAPDGNGIPPSFNWEGSENLSSVEFHWPAPNFFTQFGINTIGYKHELILPIEIKPTTDGQPITLKAQIDFGVCNEVCVPVTSNIETKLSVDIIANRSEIEDALAARPRTAIESDVQTVSCQITSIEGGKSIIASIAFMDKAPKIQQTVFEYPGSDIWVEQVGLKNTGSSIIAQAKLISYSNAPLDLDQNALRMTLIGKKQSIEINGCATPS